jgi:hypothetical protein
LRAYRTGFRYTFDLSGARRLCGASSFFHGWNQKIAARVRPESPKKDAQRDESHTRTKMMTICDIFDALSASDHPYKRAVPTDRAVDILKLCVRDEEIDP